MIASGTMEVLARAEDFRCGRIAVVGRPNVGKSTLVNALVGARVSITSRKAQTTRHRVVGILTTSETQFIFVDTPGFQTQHASALNERLNRSVRAGVGGVDVVLWVMEAGRISAGDREVMALLPGDAV
ncbi:MAG TPA: GTPase, partial [Casimicrobiaceae bacterium]